MIRNTGMGVDLQLFVTVFTTEKAWCEREKTCKPDAVGWQFYVHKAYGDDGRFLSSWLFKYLQITLSCV